MNKFLMSDFVIIRIHDKSKAPFPTSSFLRKVLKSRNIISCKLVILNNSNCFFEPPNHIYIREEEERPGLKIKTHI